MILVGCVSLTFFTDLLLRVHLAVVILPSLAHNIILTFYDLKSGHFHLVFQYCGLLLLQTPNDGL